MIFCIFYCQIFIRKAKQARKSLKTLKNSPVIDQTSVCILTHSHELKAVSKMSNLSSFLTLVRISQGVNPNLFISFSLDPFSTKRSYIFLNFCSTAKWSGAFPSSFCTLGSAPCLNKSSAISTLLNKAAYANMVYPLASF